MSPQGRFAAGAARIDGRVLEDAEAVGKHLLCRFDGLEDVLHVHLGLVGSLSLLEDPDGRAPASTRLLLRAEGAPRAVEARLSGPAVCELLDPDAEDSLRARLGPDPLGPRAEATPFLEAVTRRGIPIGQLLLDQRAIAGVGNVYRSEALFVLGISPDLPARELPLDEGRQLWRVLRRMLRAGERSGRIVTVAAADRPRRGGPVRPEDARYVYRRAGLPCRRCGATVVAWRLGGRDVFACPGCQPSRPTG